MSSADGKTEDLPREMNYREVTEGLVSRRALQNVLFLLVICCITRIQVRKCYTEPGSAFTSVPV